MRTYKQIAIIIALFFIAQVNLHADIPHYLDFKYILNQSEAGKKAQTYLKKKVEDGIKQAEKKGKALQEEERNIIKQKKVISADEYKNKVIALRAKVGALQKERNSLLDNVAKQRAKARNELLANLNPIMQKYMVDKKIRMVIDKKSMLLADENLDITPEIMKLLNNKLKTLKLN